MLNFSLNVWVVKMAESDFDQFILLPMPILSGYHSTWLNLWLSLSETLLVIMVILEKKGEWCFDQLSLSLTIFLAKR